MYLSHPRSLVRCVCGIFPCTVRPHGIPFSVHENVMLLRLFKPHVLHFCVLPFTFFLATIFIIYVFAIAASTAAAAAAGSKTKGTLYHACESVCGKLYLLPTCHAPLIMLKLTTAVAAVAAGAYLYSRNVNERTFVFDV